MITLNCFIPKGSKLEVTLTSGTVMQIEVLHDMDYIIVNDYEQLKVNGKLIYDGALASRILY